MWRLKRRLPWFIGHLTVSVLVASAIFLLILFVWYPGPLAALEGVGHVLLLIVFVDVCLGPACTLVIASPTKTRKQILRDVAAIGFLQLVALVYGVYTAYTVRPAFIVNDGERFIVVSASEIRPDELAKARSPEVAHVPLFGPMWVWAQLPSDRQERSRILGALSQGGAAFTAMPSLFVPWPPAKKDDVSKTLRPIDSPSIASQLRQDAIHVLQERTIDPIDAGLYPIDARAASGVVVVRRHDLEVLAIATDRGFFDDLKFWQ